MKKRQSKKNFKKLMQAIGKVIQINSALITIQNQAWNMAALDNKKNNNLLSGGFILPTDSQSEIIPINTGNKLKDLRIEINGLNNSIK